MHLTEINCVEKNCCLLCPAVIIQSGLCSGDLKLRHVHAAACHSPWIPFTITGQRNSPCLGPVRRSHIFSHGNAVPCFICPHNHGSVRFSHPAWSSALTEFWYPSPLLLLPAQPLTIPAELNFSICSPGKDNALFLLFKATLSQGVRSVFEWKSQVPKDTEALWPFLSSPCTSRALQGCAAPACAGSFALKKHGETTVPRNSYKGEEICYNPGPGKLQKHLRGQVLTEASTAFFLPGSFPAPPHSAQGLERVWCCPGSDESGLGEKVWASFRIHLYS